jgi:hypothetical protein
MLKYLVLIVFIYALVFYVSKGILTVKDLLIITLSIVFVNYVLDNYVNLEGFNVPRDRTSLCYDEDSDTDPCAGDYNDDFERDPKTGDILKTSAGNDKITTSALTKFQRCESSCQAPKSGPVSLDTLESEMNNRLGELFNDNGLYKQLIARPVKINNTDQFKSLGQAYDTFFKANNTHGPFLSNMRNLYNLQNPGDHYEIDDKYASVIKSYIKPVITRRTSLLKYIKNKKIPMRKQAKNDSGLGNIPLFNLNILL